jgi:hypothetical protein
MQWTSIDQAKANYLDWANKFPESPVGYFVGFAADKGWSGDLQDPVAATGDLLTSNVTNVKGIYWVSFSILDIYPFPSN